MNWAANPATKGLGASFKGVSAYLLTPKHEGQTLEERVAFTACRNLATDDPMMAWRLMAATAIQRDQIKRLAGGSNAGRKPKEGEFRPVFHYALAWHPDQTPDAAEMERAAIGSLKALKLEHHEALLVAHADQGHAHLHVVVNRVHPDTGKLDPLSNGFRKLDRWAAEYERETGAIVSPNREAKHRAIDEGRAIPAPERWLPHGEWTQTRQAERATVSGERDGLWQSQQAASAALLDAAKLRARDMARELRDRQRPGWQELGRAQAKCQRELGHALESRAKMIGFINRHREFLHKAWMNPEERQAEWDKLLTRGGLERAVMRAQAMETAEFKRDVEHDRHAMQRGFWADYRGEVDRLRTGQVAERAQLCEAQRAGVADRTATTALTGERPDGTVPEARSPDIARIEPVKRRVTPPPAPTRPKDVPGGEPPQPRLLREPEARQAAQRALRKMGLERQEQAEAATDHVAGERAETKAEPPKSASGGESAELPSRQARAAQLRDQHRKALERDRDRGPERGRTRD